MPSCSDAAQSIFDCAQRYLKDPDNFVARHAAELDPDAPPCTLVDSTKTPNTRKFANVPLENRRPAQTANPQAKQTESKCPMGFTGKNPHGSSSPTGGKCPAGFGRKEQEQEKKAASPFARMATSSFWIQALGGVLVSGVVALAIAKASQEA